MADELVERERDRGTGVGDGEFVLRPIHAGAPVAERSAAGFPLFRSGKPVTAEAVADLLDEGGREEDSR